MCCNKQFVVARQATWCIRDERLQVEDNAQFMAAQCKDNLEVNFLFASSKAR